MAYLANSEFVKEYLAAFGLEDKEVVSITTHANMDDLFTVSVRYNATKDMMGKAVDVIKKYNVGFVK